MIKYELVKRYFLLTFTLISTVLGESFAQTNKIESQGNVGIGTQNPSAPLEVAGSYNSFTQSRNAIVLRNNGGTTNLSSNIVFVGNNKNYWEIANDYGANGGNDFYISSDYPSLKIPFFINGSGYVGIGNTTPAYNLDVANYLRIGGQGGKDYTILGGGAGIGSQLKLFFDDGTENTRLTGNSNSWLNLKYGNLGIGTSAPDSKLTVKGKIHAEEIKVDLNVPAPDYVFQRDYKPISLTEIEEFVNNNHHLPEIPSAAEMEKNGINVSDMNMKFLKKIEELTLYLIEQNKKNLELEHEIKLLKKEIAEIKKY